ncbi:acyl-CoA thioester hydrolase/BAAT C-terminal domain-containing protein [Actinocorallia libanotica]|uniref:acyl-CoA thioester hydrolase/BAAT C-terminal domain-containing protein n=1 Tax=Actinocorallia libanotica TaxID=46162 RepID=UPI003CD053D6
MSDKGRCAGAQDALWPSSLSAHSLSEDWARSRVLIFPDAGHQVGVPPHLPALTTVAHPLTGTSLFLGGLRSSNATARYRTWNATLAFLSEHSNP